MIFFYFWTLSKFYKMILQYISWNPDPEIFRIVGISVRWYGLLFASGFLVGYLILNKLFKDEGVPLTELDRLTTFILIGTIIGARLGHCLFYEPFRYFNNPLEILKIWEGGLASHGAALGILLALYFYSRKSQKSFLWTLDRVVIVAALAGCFIRIGNLMNSEIFGTYTEVPWAFIFERVSNIPRHPTQLYEALGYLITFLFLLWYYHRKKGKPEKGILFGLFLVFIFAFRFLTEIIKEPQVDFETNYLLNMGQALSIPFILLGIIMITRPKLRKKGK